MRFISATCKGLCFSGWGAIAFGIVLLFSPALLSSQGSGGPEKDGATRIQRATVVTQDAGAQPSTIPSESAAVAKVRAIASYGKLPLSFEANQGQTDGRVILVAW